MMKRTRRWLFALILFLSVVGISGKTESVFAFTPSDRIPNRMVFAIRALAKDNVWIGTESGAARFDGRMWNVYRVSDGLPHDVITSITIDPRDASVWFGTFGGVGHLVGGPSGRIEAFTTKNSKLVNDVVYAVTVTSPYLWAATTNGISRFNTETREWKTFNDTNAPMNEVWCYGADTDRSRGDTWFAIWGSGILKIAQDGKISGYQDPDDVFDVDVVRNDGPLHEIQVSVSALDGIVYSGAYFGLTRYDGKNWNTWTVKDKDSGLPSDFINVVKMSPDKKLVAIGTDKGLCLYNHDAGRWATYRRSPDGKTGELKIFEKGAWRTERIPQAPAGDFIWSVDFLGDQLWVGTASGLYTAKLDW
ncbi:MAG: regulator [Candidatus Ozemobacteraceae bacterium]